ncbi:MAG: carbohydrate kinase family protein [Deltaproteobacteria bacterium]|nr:carbohydrate kinase family protein [Deltaproteobacteria bacterium]
MYDAVGIGSLNIDLIFKIKKYELKKRWPKKYKPGGEIFEPSFKFEKILNFAKIKGKFLRKSGGGSAANTIYCLAKMGFKTSLIGNVGSDNYGKEILSQISSSNSFVKTKNGKSGAALIFLDESGDRFIVVFPNLNNQFNKKDLDIDKLKKTRILHMSSFVGKRAFHTQLYAAKLVNHKSLISLDPGEIYAKKGFDRLYPLISLCNIIFLTDYELKLLFSNKQNVVSLLLESGPDIIVLKKGKKGSQIITKEKRYIIDPFYVDVKDTTGAGDVYDAAFLAGILKKWDIEDCGIFASKAAALSTKGYGRESYPGKDFLESFERKVKK